MTEKQLPELDETAKRQWQAELKRLLGDRQQKDLAFAIADVDPAPDPHARYKGAISKFLNGDVVTVRTWFGPPPHRHLEAVAKTLGTTAASLESLYRSIHAGKRAAWWHPAFPSVDATEVEIESVLVEREARDRVLEIARRFIGQVRTRATDAARTNPAPVLWVVGDGDPIAAGVLARRIQRAVDSGRKDGVIDYDLIDDDPRIDWHERRRNANNPLIAVVKDRPRAVEKGDIEVRVGEFDRTVAFLARAQAPAEVWLVGPPGSGRHVLARTLLREFEKVPGRPAGTPVIDDSGQGRRDANTCVSIRISERMPENATTRPTVLIMGEWGPAEVRALADLLLERKVISQTARGRCHRMAAQLGTEPDLLGDGAWPAQVIGMIGDIVEHDAPTSAAEARASRTRAAWAMAGASKIAGAVLGQVNERLLETYFAGLFRSGTNVLWMRTATADAAARLDAACAGTPFPDVGREPLLALLAKLREEDRPPARLVEEARRRLANPTGEAILEGLLAGGLLRLDDGVVEPTDHELARIWSARGLKHGFAIDPEGWSRLIEADAYRMAREAGIADIDPVRVCQVLEGAPEWAALDRDRWLVIFLAHSPRTRSGDPKRLIGWWASTIWTTVFGTFRHKGPAWSRHNWELESDSGFKATVRALRLFSRRYRKVLPELEGADLVAALGSLVPPPVRATAATWESVIDSSSTTPSWSESEADAQLAQEALVQYLAPAQRLPIDPHGATLPAFRPWRFADNDHAEVIADSAAQGHLRAQQFLAGTWMSEANRPDDEGSLDACWRRMPVPLRLEWIGRHGDDEMASTALARLLFDCRLDESQSPGAEGISQVMERLSPQFVNDWLMAEAESRLLLNLPKFLYQERHRQLNLYRFPLETVVAVAHRLGMADVLEAVLEMIPLVAARADLLVRGDQVFSCEVLEDATPRRLGNWSWLLGLETIAASAAEALFKLGHPDALVARWRHGATIRPSERLLKRDKWITAVNQAWRRLSRSESTPRIPAKACHNLLAEWLEACPNAPWMASPDTPHERVAELRNLHEALVKAARALLDEQAVPEEAWPPIMGMGVPVTREAGSPTIQMAKVVVRILRFGGTTAVDPKVMEWVMKIAECERDPDIPAGTNLWRQEALDDSARGAAGTALLDGESDLPIRDWVSSSKVRIPSALFDRLRAPDLMDTAWSLGRDGGRRKELLDLASRQGPDLPRPWYFQELLKADPLERRLAAVQHRTNRQVFPVLHELWATADAGSPEQALWAVLLHQLKPWGEPIRTVLRRWATSSSNPFEGPHDFQGRAVPARGIWEVQGGWGVLLHLLSQNTIEDCSPWVRTGALRLWSLLPVSAPPRERDVVDDDPEHWTLDPLLALDLPSMGINRVAALVGLLDRLGEQDALLRVIDPEQEPEHYTREAKAFDWWLKQAPVEELRSAASQSDWRMWPVVIHLAYALRDPWVGDWLSRRVHQEPDWILVIECLTLLASCYPEQLLPAAKPLRDRFPEHANELLGWLHDHAEDAPSITTVVMQFVRETIASRRSGECD